MKEATISIALALAVLLGIENLAAWLHVSFPMALAVLALGALGLGIIAILAIMARNAWKYRKLIRLGKCRVCNKPLVIFWLAGSDICSHDCIRAEKVIEAAERKPVIAD